MFLVTFDFEYICNKLEIKCFSFNVFIFENKIQTGYDIMLKNKNI